MKKAKKIILLKRNDIKVLFLLTIIISYLIINDFPKNISFETYILSVLNKRMYYTFLYFILIFFTARVMIIYNRDYNSLIRFKDKKEYIENLLNIIFINAICVFSIFNLILIMFIFFKFLGSVTFTKSDYYNIPFALYNILMYLKTFVIYELIIKMGILVYKWINKIGGILFLCIMFVLIEVWVYDLTSITSLCNIHLFFGYYLIPIQYSNIFMDLFAFILQVVILNSIIELIKFLILKYKKIYIEG